MDFVYAVLTETNVVANIVTADNADATAPLKLLIPDAHDVVLSTGSTGYPYIGGDFFQGIFRIPAPYQSWVWDGTEWTAPIDYPQDGLLYVWDEETTSWIESQPPE